MATRSASPASARSSASLPSTGRWDRLAARATSAANSSSGGGWGAPLARLWALVGGGLGDSADQLVRLVDDHHVVVRDHRDALDRVDGQQRVVGDDQVRAL